MKKKAVKLNISGNIKGTLFKRIIKDSADKFNVKGFIRNLEDGRLEVFLEGEPEDVELMVDVCNKGQASSYTRKIEKKEEKFQDFKDFLVLSS